MTSDSGAGRKLDSLRSDRRPLRSQNIFLNFAGRSFGWLFDKVTLCDALKWARLTHDRPITHRFPSGFAVYPPVPPHGVFPRGASMTFEPECQRLSNVEAIKVHDLVPRRYKVVHKFFLTVRTAVNFGQGAKD